MRTGRRSRVGALVGALAVPAIVVTSAQLHRGGVESPVGFTASALPTPAHIVVVVEENRSDANIIGNKSAPYINSLAGNGAMMTQSYAETHPSDPNYLALFAGSTFGLTSDACPVNGGAAPNLASELLAAGYTFTGFAEDLPSVGSTTCPPHARSPSRCSLRRRSTAACPRSRSSSRTWTTTCTTAQSRKATGGCTTACRRMRAGQRPTTVCW